MAENGHYDGQFERLLNVVTEIDERTTNHTGILAALNGSLREISRNTAVVADHYTTDNRELSRLAAGKNQISIYAFIILMVLCGAYVLTDKVSQGKIDIRIPFIGLEIVHGKEADGK